MQQQTNNHTIFAQFLSFRNEYKQVANDTIPLDSNQWQQEYLHFVQFERAMLENNITTAATMALRVQAYAEFVQLNGNNFFQQVQNAQIASAPAEATNATSDTIVATPVHQQESNAIERQVHVIEDDSDSGTEPIQGRKRQLSSDDDDDEESEQVQAPIRKKRRSERVSQQEPVSYHEQKVTYVKVDGIQIGNDILVLSNEKPCYFYQHVRPHLRQYPMSSARRALIKAAVFKQQASRKYCYDTRLSMYYLTDLQKFFPEMQCIVRVKIDSLPVE